MTFAGHWPITSGNRTHFHTLYVLVDRLRQCHFVKAYLHTKWHLDPSSCLAQYTWVRNWGLCLLLGLGNWFPIEQCCSGWGLPSYRVASCDLAATDMGRKLGAVARARPTGLPSFVWIHPTIWPQYSNVKDSGPLSLCLFWPVCNRQVRTDRLTDR